MAEIGSTVVATKAVDSLFGVAKKQIDYMRKCKENVEKFKSEAERLNVMKTQVQQQIGIANHRGDNLIEGVQEWLNKAGVEITKAQVFLEEEADAKKKCFKIGMCGNWRTLYHYGKGATEMTPSLLQLQEHGKDFVTCVSVETPPPTQLDVYENKNLEDLVTHNEALEDIIAALEDETKQIIGIYGLGGVGKTTLAKEVVARVKNNMLFADVAFTTVSQTVNVKEIKNDLESAIKRIVKGDKVLIILDDVWEKLNLEELCVPCGSNYKNCKILLTSRSDKVCQKMNAQTKICGNCLLIKEAWILFKRVVGERLETDVNLKAVALKVVEECGGLPLLIQAVGNALKDESIYSWNLALSRLKKHAPMDIDEDIRKSFTHLKLSYDYLKSEEAKSCFLLCSLFPEDKVLYLEDLVHYGVGLGKFDELDSVDDARVRVQYAVNILTSSGLLLKVENAEIPKTKMHDVVRDVALLIASQGNNKFHVNAGQGLTEWLPRDTGLESYIGISLMDNYIFKLPDYKVNLPRLEIFLVNMNHVLSMITGEFIGCMEEVKVVDISWNNISSLPQSFQQLTKLCTLDLRGNRSLCEISILGELTNLEILILNETGITEIPEEIARLVKLRVLEVRDCRDLYCITHGVISALWRLEELCIGFKLNFNGASDCIEEVMGLSKLTYLDLTVPSIDDIPAKGFNTDKLKGFVIQIGEYSRRYHFDFYNWSRSVGYLILSVVHLRIPLVNGLKKLIEGSRPFTVVKGVEPLSNIMPTLYDEGFNKFECIELESCPNVSSLVDDDGTRCDGDERKTEEQFFKDLKHLRLLDLKKLEVIWKCRDEYISLTNLVTLTIWKCKKLERVFTVSVAQSLVNLKAMEIGGCDGLEEVIYGGGGGDDESKNIIVFPSLTNIFLCDLPSLKLFFNPGVGVGNGHCNIIIKYPSLVKVEIRDCDRIEIWGPGIHETPNLKTLKLNPGEIALHGPCAINEAIGTRSYDNRSGERGVVEQAGAYEVLMSEGSRYAQLWSRLNNTVDDDAAITLEA